MDKFRNGISVGCLKKNAIFFLNKICFPFFHSMPSRWFDSSAKVISQFCMILLISTMLSLACVVFQMDLVISMVDIQISVQIWSFSFLFLLFTFCVGRNYKMPTWLDLLFWWLQPPWIRRAFLCIVILVKWHRIAIRACPKAFLNRIGRRCRLDYKSISFSWLATHRSHSFIMDLVYLSWVWKHLQRLVCFVWNQLMFRF